MEEDITRQEDFALFTLPPESSIVDETTKHTKNTQRAD